MSIIVALLIVSIISVFIFSLSFSKYNAYPRKELKRFLSTTYYGSFTYISQEYSITSDGRDHVWKLTFSDKNSIEFYEYYYIRNTGSRIATYTHKEYGRIWDTYTQVYLEGKYWNTVDFKSIKNKLSPNDTYIQSHYDFVLENEADIEITVETLALLYYDTMLFAKTIIGRIFICEVRNGEDDMICTFSPTDIKEGIEAAGHHDISMEAIKDYITAEINERLAKRSD